MPAAGTTPVTRRGRAASGRMVLFSFSFSLLACHRSEVPVAPVQPAAVRRVTLRMNLTPSLSNAQVMIAKDEGEFAREGIDAEFVTLDSSSANMAIATGDLDVFFAPVRSGVFNLIARGQPLQVVADKGHSSRGDCSAEAFTAPAVAADRIAKSGTFKGEKFAHVGGGLIEYLTDRLLAKHGLTRADVELISLPQGDYASSVARRVEAVRYLMEPTLSDSVTRGLVRIVASGEEVAPGAQIAFVVFGRRLLHEEPELGRRFMRAYLRSIRRYHEGKTDRNVAIVSRYTKLPPDTIRRACWTRVAADGRVDPAAVTPFLEWARAKNYLDKDLPVSSWWNPSFIEAAEKASRDAALPVATRRDR